MLGCQARNLRKYLNLAPKEVARLAKVPKKSVQLFESDKPLPLDDRRKIMAALYKGKVTRFA